jgi:hypothetical protein
LATANLIISVVPDPAPTFLNNPFAEPWANADELYSANIATNATDAELAQGDILTFALVSGPAWLTVAPNGMLSGVPKAPNTGTNTFVVSVTNLGGGSNAATMFIYVDAGPQFLFRIFSQPAATIGLPYSGTAATNFIDPDAGAGDVLTFYKEAGPAWLSVATNGALSGTPGNGDLGPNMFQVMAVNSGGLTAVADMRIMVNVDSPPIFINNPFTEQTATAGKLYAADMATNASDPNFGDVLTFSGVSGPAWLNVAPNGSLTGTPLSTNLGTNIFIVNVADYEGLSTNATMYINVLPGLPIKAQLIPQGSNLMLTWTGGIGPYQVNITTNLNSGVWRTLKGPMSETNMLLVPSNANAYYQIRGR